MKPVTCATAANLQEKKRVNQRFDEELVKLKQLWALREGSISPPAPSAKN